MSVFKDTQAKAVERRLDGVYKQCGENDYVMVRVRVPANSLSAEQLHVVARLSQEFGDGVLHLTTRGDLALHGVSFGDVDSVLENLHEVGLTTRGACGDCVRNVTACAGAGLCPNEIIDALGLARELSRVFAESGAYETLPRKFKISISGCRRGCALKHIQDIGVTPAEGETGAGEEVGLEICLAGGLGRHPKLSRKIPKAVRLSQLASFVRATIECFDELGDRKRRHHNRMKFLAEDLGFDGLLAKIEERLTGDTWRYQI